MVASPITSELRFVHVALLVLRPNVLRQVVLLLHDADHAASDTVLEEPRGFLKFNDSFVVAQ